MEVHEGVSGGHYRGHDTSRKVLRARLWWPTLNGDAIDYARTCDVCQRTGKPSRKDSMPLVPQVTLQLLARIFHLLQTTRCSTGLNGSDSEQMNDKG